MIVNENYLRTAEELKPKLFVTEKVANGKGEVLRKGDEVLFDFGNHYVGYLTIEWEPVGKHPDAPLYFSIQFYESPEEFSEKPERYRGWISPSWIQQEYVHIDTLPCIYRFERRYAFRYVKIKILKSSGYFDVKINKLTLQAVSSANDEKLLPFMGKEEDKRLDLVSVRTLHDCMQDVFEDGPKRDRRLWLGDLRLQALTNYETYQDFNLVKRCLYLFAGDTLEEGRVSDAMFLSPKVECDTQTMFDYSLFFINTLWEYYQASHDMNTLRELEPVAHRQYELLSGCFDENDLLDMDKAGSCFVDWSRFLEKQAAAQGIYIYGLKALVKIERELGMDTHDLEQEIVRKADAAKKHWYDKKKGLFVGGKYRKISYATQVWMILAGIVREKEAAELLERVEKYRFATKPSTPYMYHHYIQALIECGEKEKAYHKMKEYWGGMLSRGADTFWELYNPEKPNESPYGGKIIHSYCHAWSCTPAYFLRKYFVD